MQLKKTPFVWSLALSTLLVAGATGFANGLDGGGVGNMPNTNGMMDVMGNGNMTHMMSTMNSPEGRKMMEACANVMADANEQEAE